MLHSGGTSILNLSVFDWRQNRYIQLNTAQRADFFRFLVFPNAMLGNAMQRYAMLCNATQCFATLRNDMQCYATQCYATLRNVAQSYATADLLYKKVQKTKGKNACAVLFTLHRVKYILSVYIYKGIAAPYNTFIIYS